MDVGHSAVLRRAMKAAGGRRRLLFIRHPHGRRGEDAPVRHHRSVISLDDFAATADAIAATTSKREKVRLLAALLRQCDEGDLPIATRYFGGSVFAVGDPRTLNVGGALLSAALRELAGVDDTELARAWRRYADVGDVTRAVLAERSGGVTGGATLRQLDAGLRAVADATGPRAKRAALLDVLAGVTPDGARYVAKLI